jgi:2-dehydropantoate 2-reductase
MDMRRSVHQKRDADQAQERADPRNPNPGGCHVRIAVMAAGAVGGYFGGRMVAAGHDVTFIARGAHCDAIRRNGLKIESPLW